MKTNFFSIFFVSVMFMIWTACKEHKDASDAPVIEQMSVSGPSATDTISLSKFNTWTADWRTYGKGFIASSDSLAYFTMPKVDLVEVLGSNPTAARFYMGLQKTNTTSTIHLILVGVDSLGRSMLDYSKGQYAYDVTRPCPQYCGVTSISTK